MAWCAEADSPSRQQEGGSRDLDFPPICSSIVSSIAYLLYDTRVHYKNLRHWAEGLSCSCKHVTNITLLHSSPPRYHSYLLHCSRMSCSSRMHVQVKTFSTFNNTFFFLTVWHTTHLSRISQEVLVMNNEMNSLSLLKWCLIATKPALSKPGIQCAVLHDGQRPLSLSNCDPWYMHLTCSYINSWYCHLKNQSSQHPC